MGSVVAQAQMALAQSGAVLSVDGVWGRKTQAAYDAASTAVREAIKEMFSAAGKVAPFERRWIAAPEVDAMVHDACERQNMVKYETAIRQFLDREAFTKIENGVKYYDANSRNGGSKGIMQMQREAWADAQRYDRSLPGYDAVFKPDVNIRAAVAYAKMNVGLILKAGQPINADTLYLAHNQGAGFFSGARTAVDKQSREVRELIQRYS